MSKVLLIVPTHNYSLNYPVFLSFSDFPSGYGYLTSALKEAGHEVYGCNPNNIVGYSNAYQMIQDVISKRIMDVEPDLIGLGGLCTDYGFLKDAIGIIRNTTESPIVLGGQIVTNDAEDIFNYLKPDYAIVGEAEKTIVELANELPEPGILKAHPIRNLNTLPFPDYEPFGVQEMLDKFSMATRLLYRYSRPEPRPFTIVASRGCPFRCTFCIHGPRDVKYRE
ncbi:hypothetical protein LCGC14_2711360, partial [marine sediment metagenome]